MDYIRRIRDLREDRDKTQWEIAQVLGTSQTMYVPVLPRQRGLHPGTGRGKTEQIGSAPETNCLRGVYHQPPERETGSTRRDTVWVNWALSVLEMK